MQENLQYPLFCFQIVNFREIAVKRCYNLTLELFRII